MPKKPTTITIELTLPQAKSVVRLLSFLKDMQGIRDTGIKFEKLVDKDIQNTRLMVGQIMSKLPDEDSP